MGNYSSACSSENTSTKVPVIPAQAGIQNAGRGLDSHLRGNDGYLEGFSDEDIQSRISETISLLYSLGRAPTDIGMGKTMT